MSTRYEADFLLYLRDSPLCVKPANLPPAAEWMGAPPETFRQQPKPTTERIRGGIGDGVLLNQENRRPPLDRNGTRGSANPEDIILGPPRPNFASASTSRGGARIGSEPVIKEPDRSDRFTNLRSRGADADNPSNDRFRDRDGRPNFRRRGDQDGDADGWTPVKPRKSFGAEGAERFHMRTGAAGERAGGRDDRRTRDRDDRDPGERRSRNADFFNLKDKDGDELEEPRRAGPTRGKSDSWFRGDAAGDAGSGEGVSQRERIDKAKSWRDRDPNVSDRRGERTNERNQERRWEREREQRNERDPEWLDEPAGEAPQGRTQEDFERFMETMKGKKSGLASKAPEKAPEPAEKPTADARAELEQKPAHATPAHEPPAEDKFFSMHGGQTQFSALGGAAEVNEAARPKPVKAASRFMGLIPNQERPRTEPPTPAAPVNPSSHMGDAPSNNNEREAFAALISKLQGSRIGGTPDGASQASQSQSLAKLFERPPAQQEAQPPKNAMPPPEAFQQYGGELREDPRMRGPPQHQTHHMISPRQMMPPSQPPPVSHPEQALHDLLASRHHLPSPQTHGSNRVSQTDPDQSDFLLRLMQNHQNMPEPSANRPDVHGRMPQPTKQVSLSNMPDRDQEFQRNPGPSHRQQYHQQILQQQQAQAQAQQRQHVRGPPGPPGYMEEQFHSPEMDSRPQPTQILQRPPPPGMDHHGMLPFQMGHGPAGAGGPLIPPPQQQQQPQQRPMIPPPGLVNQRNVNPPPQALSGMYPYPPPGPPPGPGYGAPPPPNEILTAPRGMVPPPGFYGGGPPPGFMPPGMSPGGFQGGPEGFPSGPMGPYDRRTMAPPGYRGP